MRYFLRRGTEEYGPYTLADLRRFALSGNVAPTDEVRAESEAIWQPARLVLGDDAWPAPIAPAGYAGQSPAYSATAPASQPPPGAYLPAYQVPTMANGAPLPIDLHWGLLLLLTLVTCGFAAYVWILMQAWWVRKLDATSKAIWYLITYLVIAYAAIVPSMAGGFFQGSDQEEIGIALSVFGSMMSLGSIVFYFVAVFSMRRSLNVYFQTVENIGLRLGPFMTCFFAIYYFQYHMSRIAQWKKTGMLL